MVMLLFAFYQNLSAITLVTDTLILDGEMIYIEKREVEVDLDSLTQEKRNDVIAPKDQTHFWAGVNAGFSFMRVSQSTNSDSLLTLAGFLEKESTLTVQPLFNAEGGLMFNNALGIYASVGLQRISCDIPDVNESDLAPSAQITRFENRGGQLWQYYTYPVGPGFESDTTEVVVNFNKRKGHLMTVQLGGKFFLSKATFEDKGIWKVYGTIALELSKSIGDVYGALEGQHAFLLNERGHYQTVDDEAFLSKRNMFSSLVGLGIMREINKEFYWQLGVTTHFPPAWLTDRSDYRIRFSTTTINAGIVRYF